MKKTKNQQKHDLCVSCIYSQFLSINADITVTEAYRNMWISLCIIVDYVRDRHSYVYVAALDATNAFDRFNYLVWCLVC